MSCIGFAGTGDIGLPMALRLQEVAGPIHVWNRTPSKADPVVARGAWRADTPRALARTSDLIGLCFTSDDAVEEVVFAKDGLLAGAPIGTRLTIVNMSTGSPARTSDFASRAAGHGMEWVDAPVSGGVPAARNGLLTLFLGGTEMAILRAEPLLAALGARRPIMGEPGAGQATKLCNQIIVAANILAVAEATALASRAGIDAARLAEALRGGFADSLPLQIFGPRMAARTYEPRLGALNLLLKDLSAARALAADVGSPSPLSDLIALAIKTLETRDAALLDQDLSALITLYDR